MEQLGSHCAGFHEIWYWSIFRNSVEKIQVYYILAKIMGSLREDQYTFLIISRSFVLRMKMFLEELETHILCSITFFTPRKYCRLWDNVEICAGQPEMTIWRKRIACWILKATNTHTSCEILIALPLQQLSHQHASMLRYTYTAYLIITDAENVYCAVRTGL